ncbi:DUF2076 domain-containing protein [Telmatobacter sp. DSM 110680]|uniref:DUF2076 domain-containing protein n=1 Tax=Telmatobacter sp. DSM 110680 TaxID=3036704 RepID=A0AAU7DFW6_9BACT
MTPQEEQLLNSLIERVNQTQLDEKDPDAEALLNQKLAPNPDALYMLAQTVLVQNIALDQAKAQVAQLQQQLQQQRPQPAHTTSFLGRLLGEHDPAPQTQYQQAPTPPYQPVPQYAPPSQPYPQYGQPQYPQAQYVPVGQPSFLRGAMQTAAGVAAGALAFEGVESILHGFGHSGYGPGYGMGGFGMGGRPEETIINNNYYDEPGRGAEHGEHHLQDGSGAYDPRDNDPNDNLRGFDQNAGNDLATNDQDASAFADASNLDNPAAFDDQNVDDGSGFDDSGSFDDGGGSSDDGGGGF